MYALLERGFLRRWKDSIKIDGRVVEQEQNNKYTARQRGWGSHKGENCCREEGVRLI